MIRFEQSVRPMRIPVSPGKMRLAETENVPVAACREGFVKCAVRFTNTEKPFKASVQRRITSYMCIGFLGEVNHLKICVPDFKFV